MVNIGMEPTKQLEKQITDPQAMAIKNRRMKLSSLKPEAANDQNYDLNNSSTMGGGQSAMKIDKQKKAKAGPTAEYDYRAGGFGNNTTAMNPDFMTLIKGMMSR